MELCLEERPIDHLRRTQLPQNGRRQFKSLVGTGLEPYREPTYREEAVYLDSVEGGRRPAAPGSPVYTNVNAGSGGRRGRRSIHAQRKFAKEQNAMIKEQIKQQEIELETIRQSFVNKHKMNNEFVAKAHWLINERPATLNRIIDEEARKMVGVEDWLKVKEEETAERLKRKKKAKGKKVKDPSSLGDAVGADVDDFNARRQARQMVNEQRDEIRRAIQTGQLDDMPDLKAKVKALMESAQIDETAALRHPSYLKWQNESAQTAAKHDIARAKSIHDHNVNKLTGQLTTVPKYKVAKGAVGAALFTLGGLYAANHLHAKAKTEEMNDIAKRRVVDNRDHRMRMRAMESYLTQ